VGFIFQSFHLIPDLSVLDNVQIPLLYRKLAGAERKKAAREALERVGLTSRVRHYPSQMSGGQQQRVAIARAIVGRPRLLLADEPTGNLDSRTSVEVMELLRGLGSSGLTVILVTHAEEIAAWASRVIRMSDGRVLSDDRTG